MCITTRRPRPLCSHCMSPPGVSIFGASANLWRTSFQIDTNAKVQVANGYKPELGSLSGGGTLQVGVDSYLDTTGVSLNTPQGVSDQFSGVIDGTGGLVIMAGQGSLTVGGINPGGTGTFDLTVASGTMLVSNTLSLRQLNVFATPGQTTTFGDASTMNVSDVATFNNLSTFNIAFNGTAAGQFTQLVDRKPSGNPVNLGGSKLSVGLGYAPTAGDTFTIISAPGGISGQFSNITDGQTLTVNNVNFRYNQTNTAATLTALTSATTTPTTMSLVSSANPSNWGQSVTFTATVTPTTGGRARPPGRSTSSTGPRRSAPARSARAWRLSSPATSPSPPTRSKRSTQATRTSPPAPPTPSPRPCS